jgi:hypothetical protein
MHLGVMLFGLAALSSSAILPLRPGNYVLTGQSCQDAPFAAMVTFDGRGFGGPHATHCTSAVLQQRGNDYRVHTTCTALGDGSPAKPSALVERYRITSQTSFERRAPGGLLAYRLCPSR